MSFTETLFGGLMAVVALYFLARRAGLSNYWSAMLSGVLPFLAYLGLCLTQGYEADVLAIHLVVFMATAAVLGVFSSTRKLGVKMHWGPKLILGFFVVLILLMAIFLTVSLHGLPGWVAKLIMPDSGHHQIHTEFSGVSRDAKSLD